MLVEFYSSRVTATFSKGVGVGVIKKKYERVLLRFYNSRGVNRCLAFVEEWKLLESNLIKNIKKGKWPKLVIKANVLLKLIQAEICRFSLIGSNEKAMKLIDSYSMNILIRYIAVNRVTSRFGFISSIHDFILKSNRQKIDLLFQSKETQLSLFSTMKVKCVEIFKSNGSLRSLHINTLLNRVIQTQFCLLLDPFYEAKYPEHMYGFRKGRNRHQAVGFLKASLEKWNTNYSGIILVELEKSFDIISHRVIFNNFTVPNKWKSIFAVWLQVKTVNSSLIQGSIIAPIICNVIMTKALHEFVASFARLAFFKNVSDKMPTWNTTIGDKSQINTDKNTIVYEDDIAIIISNSEGIGDILTVISKSFLKFGLNFSKKKSWVIDHSDEKPKKFKYLGFSFVYVATKYITKGGVLTRCCDVTKTKISKIHRGIYLVYPCPKKFCAFKSKCKYLIRSLLKVSFVKVLSKINYVIRKFAIYYAWSNSYSRLKALDGFLFCYFKKYLIKKFRNRGIRRLGWVAWNFLKCKTASDPTGTFLSPHSLKWHPHVKLVKNNSGSKYFKKVLFLRMPSKVSKTLPITSAILLVKLRTQPYYLVYDEFVANMAKFKKKE